MTQRVIGLDIGTHAVSATELRLGRGGQVTISRFGQVAIRPGAVKSGEVIDTAEVSAAIKRLWREGGFTSKQVIVGVGNQRVVVRPTEMPAMEMEDLRSAVEFQAQELIPIPLDQVILDYQVLERFINHDGAEMLKVLIVAARRDMVSNVMSAVGDAGLEATLVDLVPFALLRSLVDLSAFNELEVADAYGEAIISFGAGITTMVVHEFGIPRFIRTLGIGSHEITQAIADDLEVSLDEAEGLKRQVSIGIRGIEAVDRAAAAINSRLDPFIEEVKDSLEFHTSQASSARLGRVIVTGGGRRVPGLIERLESGLGCEVVVGAPFARFEMGRLNLTPDQLRVAEDLAAVSLGLALAGRPVERGARRLTLMPPEVNERKEQRRNAVLVGAGVLVFGAGLFWMGQSRQSKADEAEARSQREQAIVVDLQEQVTLLQPVALFEAEVDNRQALIEQSLQHDVTWTKLIQEVATVMPDDVWIDTFVGSAPNLTENGSFTVTGAGMDHTSSARWLLRLDALESVSGLWVPNSVRKQDGEFGELSEVSFASTGVLTERALSTRLERYLIAGSDDVTLDVDEASVLTDDEVVVEEGS